MLFNLPIPNTKGMGMKHRTTRRKAPEVIYRNGERIVVTDPAKRAQLIMKSDRRAAQRDELKRMGKL